MSEENKKTPKPNDIKVETPKLTKEVKSYEMSAILTTHEIQNIINTQLESKPILDNTNGNNVSTKGDNVSTKGDKSKV